MPSKNIVFLDTETGGLIAGRHSLLSIAMVVCDARYCPIRRFETFVQHPEICITPEAMRKNRINLVASSEWPTQQQVLESMLRFLDRPLDILQGRVYETDRWLIHGKNPQFDVQMLKHFMGEHVFNSTFLYYSRDIAETFMVLEDLGLVQLPMKLSLQDICVTLGIPHDPNALHNAMYDTEMTLKCMQVMVGKLRSVGARLHGRSSPARVLAGQVEAAPLASLPSPDAPVLQSTAPVPVRSKAPPARKVVG